MTSSAVTLPGHGHGQGRKAGVSGGGDEEKQMEERLRHLELDMAAFRATVCTKEDLTREIGTLRTELHTEIGGLRGELRTEIGSLRTELHTEIGNLRSELHSQMLALTWRIIGACTTLVVVTAFIVRPPLPTFVAGQAMPTEASSAGASAAQAPLAASHRAVP
jgi:hypothetical protein